MYKTIDLDHCSHSSYLLVAQVEWCGVALRFVSCRLLTISGERVAARLEQCVLVHLVSVALGAADAVADLSQHTRLFPARTLVVVVVVVWSNKNGFIRFDLQLFYCRVSRCVKCLH